MTRLEALVKRGQKIVLPAIVYDYLKANGKLHKCFIRAETPKAMTAQGQQGDDNL